MCFYYVLKYFQVLSSDQVPVLFSSLDTTEVWYFLCIRLQPRSFFSYLKLSRLCNLFRLILSIYIFTFKWLMNNYCIASLNYWCNNSRGNGLVLHGQPSVNIHPLVKLPRFQARHVQSCTQNPGRKSSCFNKLLVLA